MNLRMTKKQLQDFANKVNKYGEYEITSEDEIKKFSQRVNCSVPLLKHFEKLSDFRDFDISTDDKIYGGAFNKYCTRYYNNRNIALSLVFDYFYGYKLCLGVYCKSQKEMEERVKKISSSGYNFITEPCWENETFFDIILDTYLLHCDKKESQGYISNIIKAINTTGDFNEK